MPQTIPNLLRSMPHALGRRADARRERRREEWRRLAGLSYGAFFRRQCLHMVRLLNFIPLYFAMLGLISAVGFAIGTQMPAAVFFDPVSWFAEATFFSSLGIQWWSMKSGVEGGVLVLFFAPLQYWVLKNWARGERERLAGTRKEPSTRQKIVAVLFGVLWFGGLLHFWPAPDTVQEPPVALFPEVMGPPQAYFWWQKQPWPLPESLPKGR
jgi:hypothetical protein